MPTPTDPFPQVLDRGVYSYRNRDFKEAIDCLQQVLDVEPKHWRAKIYLAMSYYHSGEVFTAFRHFTFLKDECTDAHIRAQAESAIQAMNQQVNSKMPEMTSTFNKSDIKLQVDVGDGSELEWVDTGSKQR